VRVRPHAVVAVLRRNFHSYFGNPAGYVFITIFIIAAAFVAFNSSTFFANNMCDLSALNMVFIWLPVIFIPAVTMGSWAEEIKLGTDELLLTLPVHDVEVVIGKYLAALAVYTVALIFALANALVLAYLGDPDWGLVLANYLGYWFVGAAFIALGLVASSLTSNQTVAFIVGTAFCLVTVFAEDLAGMFFGTASRLAAGVSVHAHFENFALGVVALSDVLYFVLLAAVMLYVYTALLGRRHWRGGKAGTSMWVHHGVRTVSLVVIAISLSVLAGRWLAGARLDATAERLNSLSAETGRLLGELPGEQPVHVQAYISPEVPDMFVRRRQSLLRVLRQFDALGGSRVLVAVHDTEPYSKEAREAEENFSIRPRRVAEVTAGRQGSQEIFLGLAVTCGPRQEVIAFLDPGLSAEYELIRSVRSVANADRRRIGVLRTDVEMFGGFDFQTMNSKPSWSIVKELQKQYDVTQVQPNETLPEDIDVLVAALPSSLAQEQMDVLAEYVESGKPTLLLIDPLPIINPQMSPTRPKRNQNPYGQPRAPMEKGDIDAFLRRFGVAWQKDVIIWDSYNPLPKLRELPPEFVFVSAEAGGAEPFNPDEAATKDLGRVVMMFPGALRHSPGSAFSMTPLLTTGSASGRLRWHEILHAGPFGLGMRMNEARQYRQTGVEYVLAARLTGKIRAEEDAPRDSDDKEDAEKDDASRRSAELNLIVVADLDVISEQFFDLRRQGIRGLEFDNVTFILNCVDQLAGDRSLIALRNRRPQYRTLRTIEARRKEFQDKKLEKETEAEQKADDELELAQSRLDDKVKELRDRKDIDARTKQVMLAHLERVESNRFKAVKAAIEARKKQTIEDAEQEMHRNVRNIENSVRLLAVVLPPLPVMLIGICVFVRLLVREKSHWPLSRSMRRSP